MPATYTKPNGTHRNGEQKYKPDPNKFLFNVDTFWFTISASNYDEVMMSGFLDILDAGRNQYYESEELKTIELKVYGYDHPIAYEIHPGQRPMYGYSIRNNDIAIYFMSKSRNDNTFPIKVQLNQFILWEKGVIGAYQESLYVLAQLGFDVGQAKPNRIDLAVHSDQFQWNLEDLVTFDYPRDITDSNKPNFWKLDPCTGDFETVYYGDRSRLQCRIYNKSKEIIAKKKGHFIQLYKDRDMKADKVWNIEFEIHRDFLKDFACPYTGERGLYDDVENLLNNGGLNLLWTHLVGRVATKDVPAHKGCYSHDSAFWKVLQLGDPDKFTQSKRFIERTKDIDATKMREVAQIRGRLKKMVLTMDGIPEGKEMHIAINEFLSLNMQYESEKSKDFSDDLTKARKKFHNNELNKLLIERKKKKKEFADNIMKLIELGKFDKFKKMIKKETLINKVKKQILT